MARKLFRDERDLFEHLFPIRMKFFDAIDENYIRRNGIRESDDPMFAGLAVNQIIVSEYSINMMFEAWKRGSTVRVINYDDTAVIYDIIHYHLTSAYEFTQKIKNGVKPELIEDLIRLDQFASVVYSKAANVYSEQQKMSLQRIIAPSLDAFIKPGILAPERIQGVEAVKISRSGKEIITFKPSDVRATPKIEERQGLEKAFSEIMDRTGGLRPR